MALSDLDVKQVFNGNGATTTFAIPFSFDSSDTSTIKVYLRDTTVSPATETLQTEGGGSDYTISGTNVVMNTAPTANEKLIIIRVTPLTQTFDPLTSEQFDADGCESQLDKIVSQIQELDERLDRAALLQLGTAASSITIPEPSSYKLLRWNVGATNLENVSATSAEFDELSPTTTEGDIIVHDGSTNIRLAGSATDNYVLTYDSAQTGNLKWAPPSGGGGGGFTWFNDDGDAPTDQVKYNNKVWSFIDGGGQNLYTTVKVPQGYIAGSQIKMYITHFHEASSATQLISSQSTLISPGDAFDDTTNQRTSTNTATAGGNKVTIEVELDLTSSTGQINSVAVAPGDLIKVKIYRGTDASTADIHFIESSTEVTFS